MPTTLITGANRGIGLEFCRQYAADGWRVQACCRDPDGAGALADLAAAADGRVAIHRLDVTDGAEVAAVAAAIDTGNDAGIDLLVNNAGVSGPERQTAADMDFDGWAKAFATNAMAPLRVAQAFAPLVVRSDGKLIVTISSRLGSMTANRSGGRIAYRSTKAAVNQVMRSLAFELAGLGVRCVLFHPGWVRTDMGGPGAALGPAESVTAMRRRIDRLTPEDNGMFLSYDGTELDW